MAEDRPPVDLPAADEPGGDPLIGRRLNHYEIRRSLGDGGMGRVYVARDTQLDRDVAIKVLSRTVSAVEEVRGRFRREARAVAALNHPNIVTVHAFESSGEDRFIVMEYVAGRTLGEAIPADGMPLAKFLSFAVSLADGLNAAHTKGVLHRGLKPENVMIDENERVKIVDFGLARLRQAAVDATAGTPGGGADVTAERRIAGTVAYLSPEQAEGKPTDQRSDIFSLGVVFHEMLVGRRPFYGDSGVSSVSAIPGDEPPSVTEVKPGLPREVARVIRRCLANDPARRYQSALDLRNDLEDLREEVHCGEIRVPGVAPPRSRPRRIVLPWVIAAGLAALAAFFWWQARGGGPATGPLAGQLRQLTDLPGIEADPTLSPDGKMVAYAGDAAGNGFDIYLLRVGGDNATNLTEASAAHDTNPRFSPDGERIAFRSERDGGGVFVMGATGESVRRVSSFGHDPAWSPDGSRLAVATERIEDPGSRFTTSQLWAIDVATGERRLLSEGDAVQPDWSPNGRRIAYWAVTAGRRDIWTMAAEGGDAVPVTDDTATDWKPRWSPDGRHVYFASDRGGSMNLWRIPVDERTGRVRGPAEQVTAGAARASSPSLARDGRRIAYVSSTVRGEVRRHEFAAAALRVGRPSAPILAGTRSVPMEGFDVSRCGEWLAYGTQGEREDIFVARVQSPAGTRRQVTNDVHRDRRPQWSPDGSALAFYSNRSGSYEIWSVERDGSRLRQLTRTPDVSLYNPVWASGGDRIAAQGLSGLEQRVYVFAVPRPGEMATLKALPVWPGEGHFFELASWSPDGERLAGFVRDRTTGRHVGLATYAFRSEAYRELGPFAGEDLSLPWLPSGDRLLAIGKGRLLEVDVTDGSLRTLETSGPFPAHAIALAGDAPRTLFSALRTRQADLWLLSLP